MRILKLFVTGLLGILTISSLVRRDSTWIVWGILAAIALSQFRRIGHREGLARSDSSTVALSHRTITINGERTAKSTTTEELDDHARKVLNALAREFLYAIERSPNGRFAVGTRDGHFEDEAFKKGFVAAVDLTAKKLLYKKSVNRPHQAWISNAGFVLVEDWISYDTLAGAVHGIDLAGNRVWRNEYKANILKTSLSDNGTHAFISTAHSPYQPHNGKLFLVQADTGKMLWTRDLYLEREASFEARFAGERPVAIVKTVEEGVQTFNFDQQGGLGAEFDSFSMEQSMRRLGPVEALFPRAREAIDAEPPRLDEVASLLARIPIENLEPRLKSKVLRLQGELMEARGNLPGAVAAFREALELNPHVGIKGRMRKLEKQITS